MEARSSTLLGVGPQPARGRRAGSLLTANPPCRYAEVVVASENSVHKLLELLPGKVLNGDKVEVRLATRQNLSQFEAQARKREWGAGTSRAAPWAPLSCQDETSGWGGKTTSSLWGYVRLLLSLLRS